MKRVFAACAAAIVLAGCAKADMLGDRANPDAPLWSHHASGAMALVFRRSLTAPGRTVGEDYERSRAAIDAPRGRIFIGSSDHGLYALRSADGSTIWRYETLGAVHSEPLYDPEMDYVTFGSHDGAIYCVRASDGALVWRFSTGAEVARKPVRVGESLFVANAADNLFAVNRRTGKLAWHRQRTPALSMEISGHGGPAYDPVTNLVFMVYSDGHLLAYTPADGGSPPAWTDGIDLGAQAEQAIGTEALRYLDVDTTPVIDDNPGAGGGRVVYVASYVGGVFAVDAERGSLIWKNERAVGVTDLTMWKEEPHTVPAHFDGVPTPVPARRRLFAASGTTGLWALEPQSGRAFWRIPLPEGGVSAPVPIAGALMVGTSRYGLFLISPLTGQSLDGLEVGSFAEAPAVYGSRAYALTSAGTLLALQVTPPIARAQTSVPH